MNAVSLPERDVDQERALVMALKLSPGQAAVLSCLMRTIHATSDELNEYTGFTHIKVFVSKTRQRLRKLGVDIKSRADIGYWIEPQDKEVILELLKPYMED